MDSDLGNISGTYSSFFYYGIEHLTVNLIHYIREGIDRKELICLSVEEELERHLTAVFIKEGFAQDSIRFVPARDFALLHKNQGLSALRENTRRIAEAAVAEGFSSVRWIGQFSSAVKAASKEEFLAVERLFSDMMRDAKSSLLCIHDFSDYINNRELMDDAVIAQIINSRTSLLSQFRIRKPEDRD